MGRADLRIAVPAYFKCPISLDIMKSPVSLSTGVTYDRSSIEKWLADGHNTCPATMQALQTRELLPNHTLRRLIEAWYTSTKFPDKGPSTRLDPQHIELLLYSITDGHLQQESLKELSRLASISEEHNFLLAKAGIIPILSSILSSRESDMLNASRDLIELCEKTLQLLSLLPLDEKASRTVAAPKQLITIAWFLKNGRADTKFEAAVLLEKLACSNDIRQMIGETSSLIEGLLNMLTEINPIVVNASVNCLLKICSLRRNQLRAVEGGAVESLLKLIQLGERDSSERVLGLLNLLIGCAEGRAAMMGCSPISVTLITKTLLRFSNLATQHAIAILWAICYTSPDSGMPQIIVESNGLKKILLLLQSVDCNSITRQKAEDLLRQCRDVHVKDDSCPLQDSYHTDIKLF